MVEVDFPGAPRVNGSMVAAFAGKPVILVGKVRSSEAGQAVLQASDGQDVNVKTQSTSIFPADSIVEIIGTASADGSVEEQASSQWGTKLDMESYNGLVQLASDKYSYLFAGGASDAAASSS